MSPSTPPYRPYLAQYANPNGPGDARPTTMQVLQDCSKVNAMHGKTALITGCTSGLGIETARALYEAGYTLFLTGWDTAKLEGIIDDIVRNAQYSKDTPRPEGIELNLDDFASIRAAAADLQARTKTLNLLVCNAGVIACPFSTTKDGIETQLGVNHFAHFLLFQLCKPLLLSSAEKTGTSSRVINITSSGHQITTILVSNRAELDAWNTGEKYNPWLAYGQSKTANIWMANSISRHYASQNLIGLSVHPGAIITGLFRHNSETGEYFATDEKMKLQLRSPQQGAATAVWTAVSDHFEGSKGGVYLADVGESEPIEPDPITRAPGYAAWAYDEEGEERLWELSMSVVGLREIEKV